MYNSGNTGHPASDIDAWINMNGTGGMSIRDSKNVSSLTYGGYGYYIVNFDTPMASANYCATLSVETKWDNNDSYIYGQSAANVSLCSRKAGVQFDSQNVNAMVIGGL